MKQLSAFYMLLLLMSMGAQSLSGQSLIIKAKDGTHSVRQLSTIKNFAFNGSNLLLNKTGASLETFRIQDIQKIYFNPIISGLEVAGLHAEVGKISLFPNPVTNTLYIHNAPELLSTVFIYRINGALLFQAKVSANQKAVDVSHLASGLYLLKMNDQTLKFIKQ